MLTKTLSLSFATLCVLSLTACGGGGGGGGATPVGATANNNLPGNNNAPNAPNTPNTPAIPDVPATPGTTVTFTRVTANSGGALTRFQFDNDAFNRVAPNLQGNLNGRHNQGNNVFDRNFQPTGNNNNNNGGLGPAFNSDACNGCHIRDGRGSQPPPGQPLRTMLLRLSIPGAGPDGAPVAAPGFGGQLQDKAIQGVQPEAGVAITQSLLGGNFGDGTGFSLEQPTFTLTNPYTALPAGLLTSPRVAPHVAGLGLLEAVPESTLLALADEFDANGDGISGKPNRVTNLTAGQVTMGRFGWKAEAPTLLQQSAAAFRHDIGISNPLFPTDPFAGQPQDDGINDDPEINGNTLDQVTFYQQTLSVPGRRNTTDATVLRGEEVFHEANCAACHVPTLVTGNHVTPTLTNNAPTSVNILEGQTIHPFTDLLLHDMGPGLADNRPTFQAGGQEWRTPPLWGVGLFQLTNGHTRYLHDGRARNLSEAILWHGGEAEASKNSYVAMSAADRNALLAFLGSL